MGQELSKTELDDPNGSARRVSQTESEAHRILAEIKEEMQKEQEVKYKKEMPRGIFSSKGIDENIGAINFSLIYDVKYEMLKVHVHEAKRLLGVASISKNLDVCLKVGLVEKNDFNIVKKNINDLENKKTIPYNGPPQPSSNLKSQRNFRIMSKMKNRNFLKSDENSKEIFEDEVIQSSWQLSQPMIGSVMKNTSRPKWDEIFVFKNIKNNQLPNMEVNIEVLDLGRKCAIKRPQCGYFFLGCVSYPCGKLYKTLLPSNEVKHSTQVPAFQLEGVHPVIKIVGHLEDYYMITDRSSLHSTCTDNKVEPEHVLSSKFNSSFTKLPYRDEKKVEQEKQVLREIENELLEELIKIDAGFKQEIREEFEEQLVVEGGYSLPVDMTIQGKDFIDQWMNQIDKDGFWPEVGKIDGNLTLSKEEIEASGFENFYPVDSESDDSGIMDSVSIRFFKRVNNQPLHHECREKLDFSEGRRVIGSQLKIKSNKKDSIKSVKSSDDNPETPEEANAEAIDTKANRRPALITTKLGMEDFISIEDRPSVIRKVGGWRFLNSRAVERKVCGELEVGLVYDPDHSSLILKIIQARNLKGPDCMPLKVHITVKCHRVKKTFAKNNGYIRNSLARFKRLSDKKNFYDGQASDNTDDETIERIGSTMKTPNRDSTFQPVWNQFFAFEVSPTTINEIVFDIFIWSEDNCLGCIQLQKHSPYRSVVRHWNAMASRPRYPINQWYQVRL